MGSEVLKRIHQSLISKYDGVSEHQEVGCLSLEVSGDVLKDVLKELRDEHGFSMLVDLTAVDWKDDERRFMVVYHLLSLSQAEYFSVVSYCKDNEDPKIASVVDLFPAANWHEREVYDMFGIVFEGHPELKRILMWDGYEHHPLRKDFPLAGVDSEFPASDVAERTGVCVQAAPMMGGPFKSSMGGTMAKNEPKAMDESWTEANPKNEEIENS